MAEGRTAGRSCMRWCGEDCGGESWYGGGREAGKRGPTVSNRGGRHEEI